MIKPIIDRAEVSVDFPGKTYMGSFTRHSGFEVSADQDGVHLHLEHRVGDHRRVGVHLHYGLLADILEEIGEALRQPQLLDIEDRKHLEKAAAALQTALKEGANSNGDRQRPGA